MSGNRERKAHSAGSLSGTGTQMAGASATMLRIDATVPAWTVTEYSSKCEGAYEVS